MLRAVPTSLFRRRASFLALSLVFRVRCWRYAPFYVIVHPDKLAYLGDAKPERWKMVASGIETISCRSNEVDARYAIQKLFANEVSFLSFWPPTAFDTRTFYQRFLSLLRCSRISLGIFIDTFHPAILYWRLSFLAQEWIQYQVLVCFSAFQ